MPVPVRMPCMVVMREVGFKYWVSGGAHLATSGSSVKTSTGTGSGLYALTLLLDLMDSNSYIFISHFF